jgi:VanZ family protein
LFFSSFFWTAASGLWTAGVLALALGPTRHQAWLMKTFGDKVLHAAAFTVGCYLWGMALGSMPAYRRSAPFAAAVISLVIGIAIEALQQLTPSRSTDSSDVVADVAGILPALALLWWQSVRRHPLQPE